MPDTGMPTHWTVHVWRTGEATVSIWGYHGYYLEDVGDPILHSICSWVSKTVRGGRHTHTGSDILSHVKYLHRQVNCCLHVKNMYDKKPAKLGRKNKGAPTSHHVHTPGHSFSLS